MKCLKTGLILSHNGNTMSCDMYGDLDKEVILLKGFGSNIDYDDYDVVVSDWNRLIPSDDFVEFMDRVNGDFHNWSDWMWVVFDTRNRFDSEINVPDV